VVQLTELQPPSFRGGGNVIPGIPSRVVGAQLWILRGSAVSTGLTAMGLAAAAMPVLMGLCMADLRPAMAFCFAVAAVVLGCVVLAHVRAWRDFLVADKSQRVVLTTRMRGRATLSLVSHEPGWGCRIVLVRRVRPVLRYYRHYRLKPGDTVDHPHGPATINEVVYEVRLSGQACQAVQLVPSGDEEGTRRVRGDAVPPLVSVRHARPAQVAQLRGLAVRLAAFLGLGFADESERQSDFERRLPPDSPGIEHVAMPIPGENAPSWTGPPPDEATPDPRSA
jgi:hypothetical protein